MLPWSCQCHFQLFSCFVGPSGDLPCCCLSRPRHAPLNGRFAYSSKTKNETVTVVFGRPFVKRFALCYRTVVCPVCDVGVLWPNGWTDQDQTWRAGSLRPWPHCLRWEPSSASPKGEHPTNFWPISVLAKWLDGSRCHLLWR